MNPDTRFIATATLKVMVEYESCTSMLFCLTLSMKTVLQIVQQMLHWDAILVTAAAILYTNVPLTFYPIPYFQLYSSNGQ